MKLKREAELQVAARRNQLIITLHEHIKPLAAKLANEQGMQVVLLRSINTLVDGPKNDITTALLAVVKAQARKLAIPPAANAG